MAQAGESSLQPIAPWKTSQALPGGSRVSAKGTPTEYLPKGRRSQTTLAPCSRTNTTSPFETETQHTRWARRCPTGAGRLQTQGLGSQGEAGVTHISLGRWEKLALSSSPAQSSLEMCRDRGDLTWSRAGHRHLPRDGVGGRHQGTHQGLPARRVHRRKLPRRSQRERAKPGARKAEGPGRDGADLTGAAE